MFVIRHESVRVRKGRVFAVITTGNDVVYCTTAEKMFPSAASQHQRAVSLSVRCSSI